jgi:hypothetical protein
MASPAQILANRRNAARSTGPRGAAGKARAARNALAHGLTAEKLLDGAEDCAAFEALRAELGEAWAPEGEVEAALVERMALMLWRMRRAAELEGRAFGAMTKDDAAAEASQRLALLTRYEAAIERGYGRCAELLARAQARRGLVAMTPQQQVRQMIDWMMAAPPPGVAAADDDVEMDEDDISEDAEL